MKLYELTAELSEFLERIDEGDIPEEAIADTLESITMDIEDKADNIACLLKSLDADITAIEAEAKKLTERAKAKAKAYDRVKEYLAENLQRANLPKVETIRNVISFRKSDSVEVNEETFLGWAQINRDDLLTYTPPKPNKTAIKKAIKEGAKIPGAQIVVKQNLQIK